MRKHFDTNKLREPIQLIANQDWSMLARKYGDHALVGDMKGKRELHIEKNLLLVYEIEVDNAGHEILVLYLLGIGSHDDIFK